MDELKKPSINETAKRMVEASRKLSFHPHSPNNCSVELPSRNMCIDIMQQLRSFLFPGFSGSPSSVRKEWFFTSEQAWTASPSI